MAGCQKQQTQELNVAVCILFYNKRVQTEECINSFLPADVNVYVLNNGSNPEERAALGKIFNDSKKVKIFDSSVNLGVSMGRNYLVGHTTEEWLLFVDNDIVMKTSAWKQKILAEIDSNSNIEVFILKVFDSYNQKSCPPKTLEIVGNRALLVHPKTEIINCFPEGASFVRRKLFERLGGYDEQMFNGFEGCELAIRAIRSGNPILARYCASIELIHNHFPVKSDHDRKAVSVRYDVRLLKKSYRRIYQKHNVLFIDNWEPWVKIQKAKFLGKTHVVDIISRLPLLKKIFSSSRKVMGC